MIKPLNTHLKKILMWRMIKMKNINIIVDEEQKDIIMDALQKYHTIMEMLL